MSNPQKDFESILMKLKNEADFVENGHPIIDLIYQLNDKYNDEIEPILSDMIRIDGSCKEFNVKCSLPVPPEIKKLSKKFEEITRREFK